MVVVPSGVVAVNPPGVEATIYPVIAEPPSDTGADQETLAWAFPATPDTLVGAPATVIGVVEEDAEELLELPAAFVATTVNV